jgi:hypothetical protein
MHSPRQGLGRCYLITALLLGTTAAQATPIRYESEIHTGNNVIAFHNHTTSGLNISSITVQLGINTIFDTNGSGLDGLATALSSSTLATPIPIGHFTPAWSATNTSAQVGLVGTLSSLILDGSNTVTFNFTDFNPGEAWGVFVDMDTLNNSQEGPAGAAMNGVFVSVSFQGVATPLTSSCTDPAYTPVVDECYASTFSGNKRSFPSANSADAAVSTPEPATFLIAGIGFLSLGLLARTKKATIARQ